VNFSTGSSLLTVVIKIQSDLLHYKQAVKVSLLLKTFSLSANLVVSNLQQKG
jgi:hypothetical protein